MARLYSTLGMLYVQGVIPVGVLFNEGFHDAYEKMRAPQVIRKSDVMQCRLLTHWHPVELGPASVTGFPSHIRKHVDHNQTPYWDILQPTCQPTVRQTA